MTDKAFLRIVVSFVVLHLVAAVGLLIMEATVKALETKVAQLEANLGKKSETVSSSHGATSSSIALADHSLRIKPETFSAASGENWLVWLRKFKNIASLNKWTAELQCQILPAYLKGLAEQTYYSLTAEQTSTWEGLQRALTDRFHPKESRQVHVSTLRAKLRRPDEDLHQLRCEIARLVELAYPDDPLVILDRTARDFFIGALTPLALREKVLDLGPNTLDEALAAAQRYESNQKVLNKGSAHVLSSASEEMDGNSTLRQGTPEPPVWAQQLFQQQAEILEKLKNIPQGRQGRNDSVEYPQGPRACFKCGSLNHFIRNCPHQVNHDQGNWRRAGRSQK